MLGKSNTTVAGRSTPKALHSLMSLLSQENKALGPLLPVASGGRRQLVRRWVPVTAICLLPGLCLVGEPCWQQSAEASSTDHADAVSMSMLYRASSNT